MKPRILETTKILAVALSTTVVACTVANPADDKPRAEPQVPAQPAPPPEAQAPGAAATQAQPASAPAPEANAAPPERPMSKDPALLALAHDLARAGREKALADAPRFRPLCDADGYPLVGNVMTKDTRYQPSAFCATVREKRAAR